MSNRVWRLLVQVPSWPIPAGLLVVLALPGTVEAQIQPMSGCSSNCTPSLVISQLTFQPSTHQPESGPFQYTFRVGNGIANSIGSYEVTCLDEGLQCLTPSPVTFNLSTNQTQVVTVGYSTLGTGVYSQRHIVTLYEYDGGDVPIDVDTVFATPVTVVGAGLAAHLTPMAGADFSVPDVLLAAYGHTTGILTNSVKLFIDGVDRTSAATVTSSELTAAAGTLNLSNGTHTWKTYVCAGSGRCDTTTTTFRSVGPPGSFALDDSLPPPVRYFPLDGILGGLPPVPTNEKGCATTTNHPEAWLSPGKAVPQPNPGGWVFTAGVVTPQTDSLFIYAIYGDHVPNDGWPTCTQMSWPSFSWSYWLAADSTSSLWNYYPYSDSTSLFAAGITRDRPFYARAWGERAGPGRPSLNHAGVEMASASHGGAKSTEVPVLLRRRPATGARPAGATAMMRLDPGAIKFTSLQVQLNGVSIVTNGVSVRTGVTVDTVGYFNGRGGVKIRVLPTDTLLHQHNYGTPAAFQGGWNEVRATISDSSNNATTVRSRFVVLPPGTPGSIALTPLRDFRKLDQGECAAFGSFQCGGVIWVQSLPGFVSRDKGRGLNLVYRSSSQRSRTVVPLMAFVSAAQKAPDSFRVTPKEGVTVVGPITRFAGLLGTPTGKNTYPLNESTEEKRAIGAEVNAGTSEANSRAITAELKHYYAGGVTVTDTMTRQVIQLYLSDNTSTRFGRGWQLAELSRLVTLPAWQGVQQRLWLSGDGSYTIFTKPASTWVSPPGETASLIENTSVSNPDSARFTIRLDNGATVGYRQDGWQAWTSDLVGNRTTFSYQSGAPGRLTWITDPNGTRFEMGYVTSGDDGYVDTISVRPSGQSARRVATLGYSSGRLTSISIWWGNGLTDVTQFGYSTSSTEAFLTTVTDPRHTVSKPIISTITYDTTVYAPNALNLPIDNRGVSRQILYRDAWRRSVPRPAKGRGLGTELLDRTVLTSQLLGTSVNQAGSATDYAIDRFGGPTFVRSVSPGDEYIGFMFTDTAYRHDDRHIERDTLGRVTKIVHMRDSVLMTDSVMYSYDTKHRLVKIRRASAQYPLTGIDTLKIDSTLFTYDSVNVSTTANPGAWCNRILTSTDPMGGLTSITYGTASGAAKCRPVRAIGVAFDTTQFFYSGFTANYIAGRPTSVKDPIGITTTVTYHTGSWNTATTTRSGSSGSHQAFYNTFGRPDSLLDPANQRTRLWYDSLGRVRYQKTGTGATAPTTRTTYGAGGLVSRIDVYPATSTDTTPAVSPVAQTTLYFYDRLAQLDSTIGSGGRRQWNFSRDPWGVPARVYTGNGSFTAAIVNWRGQVAIAANSALIPGLSFDGKAFATGTDLTKYNGAQALENGQLSDGQNYWYSYNAKGQLVKSEHQEMDIGTFSVRTRSYTRTGQLAKEVLDLPGANASVTRKYTYNARGQRTVAQDSINSGGTVGSNGIGTIEYKYDTRGRLDTIRGLSGATAGSLTEYARVTYTYGIGNRLTSVAVRPGPAAQTLTTAYTYDAAGRMTGSTSSSPAGGTLAGETVTSFTNVDDVLAAGVTTPTRSGSSRTYSYATNGTRRLTAETDSWSPSSSTWIYDVFGNRLREVRAGANGADTLGYDLTDSKLRFRRNGLAGGSNQAHYYWYDQAGNRILSTDSTGLVLTQETRMAYTAANQLAWSLTHNEPGSTFQQYTANWHWYDAEGARVASESAPATNPGYHQQNPGGGPRTFYFYDGSDVAIMLLQNVGTDSAIVAKRFLTGGLDNQLAVQMYGSTNLNLAIISDRRGSVLGAMRPDGTLESQVMSWTTNAFGSVASGSGTGATNLDVGFAGASSSDPKAGFTYMRNRWYDPLTGRFLTQDPIGLAGGVNLYAYAGNNPVAFSDPFGLCSTGDDPPETIEVRVTVFCGFDQKGNPIKEERTVIARRVTDAEQIRRLNSAAERLKGGSADYPPSATGEAIKSAEAVYVYDSNTEDGKMILTGGEAVGNYLAFRANDWANIQKGPGFLNRDVLPPLSNGRAYKGTACGTIGHEGIHLIQHRLGITLNTEQIAQAVTWSCR